MSAPDNAPAPAPLAGVIWTGEINEGRRSRVVRIVAIFDHADGPNLIVEEQRRDALGEPAWAPLREDDDCEPFRRTLALETALLHLAALGSVALDAAAHLEARFSLESGDGPGRALVDAAARCRGESVGPCDACDALASEGRGGASVRCPLHAAGARS